MDYVDVDAGRISRDRSQVVLDADEQSYQRQAGGARSGRLGGCRGWFRVTSYLDEGRCKVVAAAEAVTEAVAKATTMMVVVVMVEHKHESITRVRYYSYSCLLWRYPCRFFVLFTMRLRAQG